MAFFIRRRRKTSLMKTALLCFVLALFYLPIVAAEQSAPTQIAFLPDVHFHDVYAEFNDSSFQGIKNENKGKRNKPIEVGTRSCTSVEPLIFLITVYIILGIFVIINILSKKRLPP